MIIDDFINKSLTKAFATPANGLYDQGLNPGYETIYFCFDNDAIKLTALPDTDEIDIQLLNDYSKNEMFAETILEGLIGRQLTYTWHCENTNNYFDAFLLSFTYLKPNIMVLSEGSCLKLFDITPS